MQRVFKKMIDQSVEDLDKYVQLEHIYPNPIPQRLGNVTEERAERT